MKSFASTVVLLRTTRWFQLIILITAGVALLGIVVAQRVTAGWMDQSLRSLSDGIVSTPSQVAPLLSGDTRAEVGDMVFLNDVRVIPRSKAHVFVVSGAQGKQMLVVSDAGRAAMADSPMTVDIQGRIRRLPPSAVLRKEWKLSKDEVRNFGEQGVYIAAESMKETKEKMR